MMNAAKAANKKRLLLKNLPPALSAALQAARIVRPAAVGLINKTHMGLFNGVPFTTRLTAKETYIHNPMQNPAPLPSSWLELALGTIGGNMLHKAALGGLDYAYENNATYQRYGALIRLGAAATVNIATVVAAARLDKSWLMSVGLGMATDTIPRLGRTLSAAYSPSTTRYLGGIEANKLVYNDPAKPLLLMAPAAAAGPTPPPGTQAGIKGYLTEGEASQRARSAAWVATQQVAGYRPAGMTQGSGTPLLGGYRPAGMTQGQGSPAMSGLAQATNMIRTMRTHRLLSSIN